MTSTKTPEQIAEEYVSKYTTGSETYEHGLRNGFCAGYKAAQGWTSVRDSLPEVDGDMVLVSDGDCCAVASYIREDKKFYYLHPTMHRITHWQPLPSLPRGEK